MHGYQVPLGKPISDVEMTGIAEMMARWHRLSENYMPFNRPKPYAITSTHLPQGFIHCDITPNNIIYDSQTHAP